jgi:glycosyltransferase involved in cell wall biosynthesis
LLGLISVKTMPYRLTGKNILIISPQEWGTMRVSKHHYAVELARRGNTVFFLNPPAAGRGKRFSAAEHAEIGRLVLVEYRPFLPVSIRFHARWLWNALIDWQMRTISRRLGRRLDVVWCFDLNLFHRFDVFGAERVIYHIVDDSAESHAIEASRGSDVIVSVAREILARFDGVPTRKLLVNHGVSEEFLVPARDRLAGRIPAHAPTSRIQVGYIGNLWKGGVDHRTFHSIIQSHPEVDFHFWGAYRWRDSNLSGVVSPESTRFVEFLQASANVTLHGAKTPERVAAEIQEMDAFMLCHDFKRDANGGFNSHKILEYLSTGKVVISTPVSAYDQHRELIRMPPDHDAAGFVAFFGETLSRLSELNRADLQAQRMQLALQNSYASHVDAIEAALS